MTILSGGFELWAANFFESNPVLKVKPQLIFVEEP
jgi:hypothetical protein